MQKRFEETAAAVEDALARFLPVEEMPQRVLLDAMRYSLLGGGKRLRGVLLLEFCRMCGGNIDDAMPFACALEMIHAYSLVHDDLPCMDDDDVRRGKPSCHVAFGEAAALLAGSALLSSAFEVMLKPSAALPASRALRAAYILAEASGLHGIAGGQLLDLTLTPETVDGLRVIHERKTAALFIAAAEAGCVIAGALPELESAARNFGMRFGMGFQYADDFTDTERSDEGLRRAAEDAYTGALGSLTVFGDAGLPGWLVEQMVKGLRKCRDL